MQNKKYSKLQMYFEFGKEYKSKIIRPTRFYQNLSKFFSSFSSKENRDNTLVRVCLIDAPLKGLLH